MDESARDRADDRIERAREVYEGHGVVFRWLWVAVAVIIVLGGLVMTVFPGPATVVIPIGLAMLAVVFGWARRLLLVSVDQGAGAWQRFRDASMAVKALTIGAVVCVAAAVATWLLL